MHAKHITKEERVKVEALLKAGHTNGEIADLLGRHRSTIGRELARGGGRMRYRAGPAERRRRSVRAGANAARRRLAPGSALARRVEADLRRRWSPEQSAGRMRLEGSGSVCHETVYRWLYRERRDLIPFLRLSRKRRYRRRRGTKIRERRREEAKKRRIDERPEAAEERSRLGDWEGDTIVGRERTEHVLTHVDRKSGKLLADVLHGATAERTRKATARRFRRVPKRKRLTITYDNGTQFAEHERTERETGATIYFAYPYHSWERGTNENTNGLLRQFLPKGTPFAGLTQRRLDRYVRLINNRPRKRLGYRTPEEAFSAKG